MDGIMEVLKSLNLAPALYGTAVVLAVLLRYGRGMMRGLNSEWTYVAGVALGLLGALLHMAAGDPWNEVALTGLSLAAVVLVLQKVLEKAAEKLSWLPRDNEWSQPKGEPK